MEIRKDDKERLVFTKEDVQILYAYYKDILIVPKYDIDPRKQEFMRRLWGNLSLIASPTDLIEEKPEFK
jgi:hypothetical protein